MRVNPDLAAGSGAATRARVIVFSVPQIGRTGDAQERRRLLAAAAQIDVAALQSMLAAR